MKLFSNLRLFENSGGSKIKVNIKIFQKIYILSDSYTNDIG
jgi:hypothetical protein